MGYGFAKIFNISCHPVDPESPADEGVSSFLTPARKRNSFGKYQFQSGHT